MPIYYNKNKTLLFIHIPKCAGTTIEQILRSKSELELLHNTGGGVGLDCNPQHFHREPLESLIRNVNEVQSFTVVRNPLLRIISEYTFSKARFENNRKNKYFSVDVAINNYINSFWKKPYFSDNHIRPQIEFLLENTDIFRLEDGIDNIVEYINRTYLNSCSNQILYDNSRKNKSYKDKDLVISLDTIKKVEEFYKYDYLAFGYALFSPSEKKKFYSYEEIVNYYNEAIEFLPENPFIYLVEYQRHIKKSNKYIDVKFSISELIECYPTLSKKEVLRKRVHNELRKNMSDEVVERILERLSRLNG